MEIRAAATQKAEVPAARACGEASLAAAVFVELVAFDAGADVGAEVASWRSGASSGSTLPPLYWVAAGTGAAESAAATVWAAKANAIKEMQRMVKDVPARVE
eukprot:TRINITY_DN1946_c0_g1_i3.p4 TRINITY_DN1946_c0_g1~~TRINITY_DN1946_c0_g1_i3.p4  ORF type:complete len:102 (+),score=38.70 TRINITY_DN1946_c0_g1_i3:579-884(+)